jgi:uncharacterized protein with PIN domain
MENKIYFSEFDKDWEHTTQKCPTCEGRLRRTKCETINGRFDYIYECVDCGDIVG